MELELWKIIVRIWGWTQVKVSTFSFVFLASLNDIYNWISKTRHFKHIFNHKYCVYKLISWQEAIKIVQMMRSKSDRNLLSKLLYIHYVESTSQNHINSQNKVLYRLQYKVLLCRLISRLHVCAKEISKKTVIFIAMTNIIFRELLQCFLKYSLWRPFPCEAFWSQCCHIPQCPQGATAAGSKKTLFWSSITRDP